ncbi:DUF4040 domain-containing protein [Methanonatronarchaeum sp. AMET6-2]|uniref:DUF4040 domain-containing protein n=1 Tax=Methanonatronarchaeum sp. AMET6-2 TaxID=2933293 RepID=UPI00122797C9|nr:DUF4040 domain-containing protein [Methanonatronarchaeum sp. AMET6-2]RZN61156.1 MAG: DUF4040 domain-containing protein [Methanonatronarchaeia archaeon]UOY09785.1 DUF4040 domain-containing protein [Methanonatronarchaeum sp. AMET6-2]
MELEILLHLFVLSLIVLTAYLSLTLEDIIASVVALAVMSLLLALEFYMLQAPDVAMAEAAIGAGLTTAIFILAIRKTERWEV